MISMTEGYPTSHLKVNIEVGRNMARPKKKNGPHIYWRNGRAYADLRAYSDVGGGREALNQAGSSWGTTDEDVALILFESKLAELKAKRRGRVGVPEQKSTTLAELTRHHLLMKARAA